MFLVYYITFRNVVIVIRICNQCHIISHIIKVCIIKQYKCIVVLTVICIIITL